jgi:hypothetical protein
MEVTAFNAIIIFFILQIRLTIKILTVLFKHFNRLHFHIYINSYIINYKKQYKNITEYDPLRSGKCTKKNQRCDVVVRNAS